MKLELFLESYISGGKRVPLNQCEMRVNSTDGSIKMMLNISEELESFDLRIS